MSDKEKKPTKEEIKYGEKVCSFLTRKEQADRHTGKLPPRCPGCGINADRWVFTDLEINQMNFISTNMMTRLPVYITQCKNCGCITPFSKRFVDEQLAKEDAKDGN